MIRYPTNERDADSCPNLLEFERSFIIVKGVMTIVIVVMVFMVNDTRCWVRF